MRWNPARILFAVAAATMLWAAVAVAEPIAFVVAMKGSVTVTPAKGGAAGKATLGRPLERGDKLTVAPGGTASLYFSDGNVVELGGGSSMTVGGKLVAADGKKRVGPGSEASAEVFNRVSKFITSESKQSGLVALSPMRGADDGPPPMILAPRRSATLSGRPSFQWRAVAGATRYRVSVSNDEGELWNRELADTSLAYPADAKDLALDGDYLWDVQALSDTGPLRKEESTFRVLAEGEAAQVKDHVVGIVHAAGDTTAAGNFLVGSYLVGRGLYGDAAQRFEALCRIQPNAPGPHEALGSVYQTVGLKDLAAVELARAKALAGGQ